MKLFKSFAYEAHVFQSKEVLYGVDVEDRWFDVIPPVNLFTTGHFEFVVINVFGPLNTFQWIRQIFNILKHEIEINFKIKNSLLPFYCFGLNAPCEEQEHDHLQWPHFQNCCLILTWPVHLWQATSSHLKQHSKRTTYLGQNRPKQLVSWPGEILKWIWSMKEFIAKFISYTLQFEYLKIKWI